MAASIRGKVPEGFFPAPVPAGRSLAAVRVAARHCTACPLYRNATQTVFGEGGPRAELVLVGEQPGDREDLEGHPFVGPAGRLLDRALAEAGIDRGLAYVTNAVKHFKWEPVGRRRQHKKPSAREMPPAVPGCGPSWISSGPGAGLPRWHGGPEHSGAAGARFA